MLARVILVAILFVATRLEAADPPITAAAFSPDGNSIVTGSQGGIQVYAWPELTRRRALDTGLNHVHDLAFSDDGKTLVAVGGRPAETGGIELFAWPRGKPVHARAVGDDLLTRIAWHHGDEWLAAAGPDHRITLLDRSANIVEQLAGHSRDVVAVVCLPDGYFISGSRDDTLRVWNRRSHEPIRTLNNHTGAIHDVAPRPGSAQPPYVIASSSADRTVRFWWPVRGRLMRFVKLPSPALDIEWSADGAALVAVCADGHLRTIDPETVQTTRDVRVGASWLYTLAVPRDGDRVFVGGGSGLMQAVKFR